MSAKLPPIRGFIENTLIDWEGKIACEVFLPNCNLRCPFCHAGHLLTHDGELESIPVTACLDRHRGWVDGVVISGGEPTLHPTLDALIEEFRAHGAMIKLDTNGTQPDVLADLLGRGLLEAVSMDIKAPFDERYYEAAGGPCDVAAICRSAEIVMGCEADYEFRTTVCPPFHTLETLREMAQAIHGAKTFVLQQFVPVECLDPAMNSVQPYDHETLGAFATELGDYVDVCIVRGDWAGG